MIPRMSGQCSGSRDPVLPGGSVGRGSPWGRSAVAVLIGSLTRRERQRCRVSEPVELFEFRRTLTQQFARDDELLDLLCALENVEDLRVATPLLQQRLLGVSDGSHQFYTA